MSAIETTPSSLYHNNCLSGG